LKKKKKNQKKTTPIKHNNESSKYQTKSVPSKEKIQLEIGNKTVQSAVVIIPPQEIWDQIEAIRKIHDKSYERWMPHINIVYPFVPCEDFEEYAPKVKKAVSTIKPFTIKLRELKYFVHNQSATLWLNPETETKSIHSIQSNLEKEISFCKDLSKLSDTGYNPHLSVGQWVNEVEIKKAQQNFQNDWKEIEFEVSEVYLISRTATDPFKIHYRIPFESEIERLVQEETPNESSNGLSNPTSVKIGKTQFYPYKFVGSSWTCVDQQPTQIPKKIENYHI